MTTVKIRIDVADLDEAGAFYCQALQCTEVGRNSRTVTLTAGGNELYLILRPESSMPFLAATEGRSFARHWTPVHLDFALRTSGGPHRRSPGSAQSSRARSRATGQPDALRRSLWQRLLPGHDVGITRGGAL